MGILLRLVRCFVMLSEIMLAAGGRFSYGRTLRKLDGVTLNLDESTQFEVMNMYQLKHSYSAMEFLGII